MIVNVMSAKKIKAKRKDKDKSVQYYIDEANKVKALKEKLKEEKFLNLHLQGYIDSLVEHNKALEQVVRKQDELIKVLED